MKKIIRLSAAVVVGGIVTFGGIAPSSAELPPPGPLPLIQIGGGQNGGSQIDVFPKTFDANPDLRVLAKLKPITTVKVLGQGPSASNNTLGAILADPLPVKTCVFCQMDAPAA